MTFTAPAATAARGAALEGLLARIAREYRPAALANSLSAEDMVLTDAIARAGLPIGIFVLDTGRLHDDTLALIGAIRARYGIEIESYRPDPQAVTEFVARHGANAF